MKRIVKNIIDLNFDICSRKWDLLSKVSPKKRFVPSIFEGGARAVYFLMKSLGHFHLFAGKGDLLVLVGTLNQEKALSKINFNAIKGSHKILGYHNYKSQFASKKVPSLIFYLVGLIPGILCIPLLYCQRKTIKESLLRRFERVIVASTAVLVWRVIFRLWKSKIIIISNDHSHWTRAAIKAAKAEGIYSCYIPHSITSDTFPRLDVNCAFLDSEFQFEAYNSCGIGDEVKVLICGALRYERLIASRNAHSAFGKKALICFNMLDSLTWVEQLILRLKSLLPEKLIYVKAHPGDRLRFNDFIRICNEQSVNWVEPNKTIQEIGVKGFGYLFGGITGAHIDAAMLGVLPVTFDDWYEQDYYGLLEKGKIFVIKNDDLAGGFLSLSTSGKPELDPYLNAHLNDLDKLPSSVVIEEVNNILDAPEC